MTTLTQTVTTDAPLKLRGELPRLSLEEYPRHEITPAIGIKFDESVRLTDALKLPEDKKADFFKRLAYEISLNGLSVFSNQDDLTDADLEEVGILINKHSGAAEDAGVHIHPVQEFDEGPSDTKGSKVLPIISGNVLPTLPRHEGQKARVTKFPPGRGSKIPAGSWHSDVSFERRPASYSLLQIHTLPRTGGDTMFLSNYAVYDKLTPVFQELLEKLTVRHSGAGFKAIADYNDFPVYTKPRGAPENVDDTLEADHPAVRTNPVTGLKAVFINNGFSKYFNELNFDESEALLTYIKKLQTESHDVQVRVKWNKNDLAIWDNRVTNHSATNDYGKVHRIGRRTTLVGEIPYLDKNSISKKQFDQVNGVPLDQPLRV